MREKMENKGNGSEDILTLLIKQSYKDVNDEDLAFLSELCQNSFHSFTPGVSGNYSEAVANTIQENIHGISDVDGQNIANNINETIFKEQAKFDSFREKVKARGLEEAIYDSLKASTSGLSTIPQIIFFSNLDLWLSEANIALKSTCATKSGMVNMSPQLHGFIAEKMHEVTFNLNAALTSSPYRALVLTPDGSTYAKNSVDIVIKDSNGVNRRRYQVKYCQDELATNRALDSGDYRGQHPLVPSDEAPHMSRNVSDVIQSPDGKVSSKPLSYDEAKQLQFNVQNSGDPGANKITISDFDIRELSNKMAVQVGYATLIGATLSAGIETINQISKKKNDDVSTEEFLKAVGSSSSKGAAKAACISFVSSALEISREKGKLFDNCSNESLAAISIAIVESSIICYKMATGELSVIDGLAQIEVTVCAVYLGCLLADFLSGVFEGVGETIGTFICPGVGTIVGEYVGKILGNYIGYFCGNFISRNVVPELQAIRNNALQKVSEMGNSFVTEARIKNVERKYCTV